ncbi:hypothetical protein K1719_024526 [Acacia pycnantha]|nr:hypothetical protein K1719_024526 [Acacia pycnantha]
MGKSMASLLAAIIVLCFLCLVKSDTFDHRFKRSSTPFYVNKLVSWIGFVGKKSISEFQAPYPREIPRLPWHRRALAQMAPVGWVPFNAICIYVELDNIICNTVALHTCSLLPRIMNGGRELKLGESTYRFLKLCVEAGNVEACYTLPMVSGE